MHAPSRREVAVSVPKGGAAGLLDLATRESKTKKKAIEDQKNKKRSALPGIESGTLAGVLVTLPKRLRHNRERQCLSGCGRTWKTYVWLDTEKKPQNKN